MPDIAVLVNGESLFHDPIDAVLYNKGIFTVDFDGAFPASTANVFVMRALGMQLKDIARVLHYSDTSDVKLHSDMAIDSLGAPNMSAATGTAFDFGNFDVGKAAQARRSLTTIQHTVLCGMALGQSIEEIAETTGKQPTTIKTQQKDLRGHLGGAPNAPSAVVLGHLTGVLQPQPVGDEDYNLLQQTLRIGTQG